jgi:hypothetical protein
MIDLGTSLQSGCKHRTGKVCLPWMIWLACATLPGCAQVGATIEHILPQSKHEPTAKNGAPAAAVATTLHGVTPTSLHRSAPTAANTARSTAADNAAPGQPAAPVLLSLPAASLQRDHAALPAFTAVPAPISAPAPQASPVAAASQAPPIPAAPGESASPPGGFLLPAGLFGKPAQAVGNTGEANSASITNATTVDKPATQVGSTAPNTTSAHISATAPQVSKAQQAPLLVYASPTTSTYFAAGGINYQNNIDTWLDFLRRHNIAFELVSNLDALDRAVGGAVLLPSALALSEAEKRALARYRDNGGAILATWLCGVRNERGEWTGFGFMERVLNVKVTGNTEADQDDTFLMPFGDSPVSHQLPSGLRIWTERIPDWYPLRLTGQHMAGAIMDWSRTVQPGKNNGMIAYDRRDTGSGRQSRAVVLGYPERLWLSADRQAFDALAQDALSWLLRQPDVYNAAWPYPYGSAMVLAVNTSEVSEETDAAYAKQTEDSGWRGTYYVLSERADNSKALIQKLQARGHAVGFFGDRLNNLQNQSVSQQGKRLDTMIAEAKEAGIELGPDSGFRAPLESYDATTIKLLKARGFGHMITDQGASEARLPVITPPTAAAPTPAATAAPPSMVLLPRTLSSPEDLLADGDPALAVQNFMTELDLSNDMAALGVLAIPTRTSLSPAQWSAILAHLKTSPRHVWLATAAQVTHWWHDHQRVSVSVDANVTPALLTVEVSDGMPLQQPITLLANLPEPGNGLRLVPDAVYGVTPKVASFDDLRAAIILEGLTPGKYYWYLYFDQRNRAPIK